ncbi:hydrogenase maturation protease [Streptomyces sp. NPDC002164]|uniref:hydrogenase maturation protease n=1 Tax=Streptomyces sp. NPDC002164 TaxID=3364633 RepID=UPI0036C8AF03
MVKPLTHTLVIGIGNEFRRDDGAGWAVVALLGEQSTRRPLPVDTVLARSDGEPGRLIALWENVGLAVVVDACFLPSAHPGRTHRWCDDPAGVLRAAAGRHSTHGLGLAEALRLGESIGSLPDRLVLYAVEGADYSPGLGLTPEVAHAVPRLARRITVDIEERGGPPSRGHRAG